MALLLGCLELSCKTALVHTDFLLALGHGEFELVLLVLEVQHRVLPLSEPLLDLADVQFPDIVLDHGLLSDLEYFLELHRGHVVFQDQLLEPLLVLLPLLQPGLELPLHIPDLILQVLQLGSHIVHSILGLVSLQLLVFLLLLERLLLLVSTLSLSPGHLPLQQLDLEFSIIEQLLLSVQLLGLLGYPTLQVSEGSHGALDL